MDDVDSTNATPEPERISPPRRSGWRLVGWLVGGLAALLVVLVIAVVGLVWWSARSESGSAWLLSRLPGVQATAPRGALLGDFEVQRLVVQLPASADVFTLTGLGWKDLTLRCGNAGRWLFVGLGDLHASRVDVALGPSAKSEPLQAPTSLALPVEVDLRSLRVGEIHAAALGDKPLRDLQGSLHLGAADGSEHRIDKLSLEWDRLHASASGRIASGGAMGVQAVVELSQQANEALPAWSANAKLDGPLVAPTLQATVRAQPSADRPAQSLDANAELRPFASWPLGGLRATVQSLDLSAFASAAPATALSGNAVATSTGLDQPASVKLDASNSLAGRWDEKKLPLRSVTVQLAARPDDTSTLDVSALDADLGTERASAGHVTGQGRWTAARWNVDAALKDVQPAALDARAAPMLLSGPVTLVGSTGVSGGTGGGASGGTSTGTGTGTGANVTTIAPTIDIKSTLDGRWIESAATRGLPRTAQLTLDASINPLRVELRNADVRAGGARATLSGSVARETEESPWAVKGQAALVAFDPAVWWPGQGDSSWRKAPTTLNAKGSFDLIIPLDIAQRAPIAMLTAPRGRADLTLSPSTLVGVPVSGTVRLVNTGGTQSAPTVTLDASGNHLQADGRLAATGNGAGDRWDVAIDADALDRLAPVFKLFMPAGADASLAGSLNAKARINGRWPAMNTQGELDARGLRVSSASVQQAKARWQLGSTADAAVDAHISVGEAAVMQPGGPGPSIESLQLDLSGTGRSHALNMRALSKVLPPAWTDMVQPGAGGAPVTSSAVVPTQSGRTVATLQAQGGFIESAGAAWAGWRGKVQQVEVRTTSATATATATATGTSTAAAASAAAPAPTSASNVAPPSTTAPLLRTRDVTLEAQWSGGPARVTVQPGRAEVLGGAIRWSRIAWTAATVPGSFAQIEAQADIEPLRIAPLLARAQPDFGWGGDMAIAGHLNVKSAPAFSADIVVERTSGDLTVTDELSTQALGITDLRLALNAENGVWNFTQALAGKTVGVAAGAVVARTSPQATWPPADTPLQGVIELEVANLGTWGTWVPPGWRIDGALRTSASIGGRFGAPEYTGQIDGKQLGVRNFLQGVNVSDGDVSISLRGDTAHIERFTAKAGNGTLQLEGSAVLGAAPKADLKMTADKFQLLGRVDRRIVASGQARLQLDSKTLALDGKFTVDEGLIDFSRSDAPTLGDDVDVIRAKGVPSPAAAAASAAAPTTAPPPGRNVALNLNVNMGDKFRVRGRGLDSGLRGDLHITSPGGKLAVNGTISTVDGTYQAYGQKLEIDRGEITFTGAVDNPRLDIEATRPNLDIRVGVAVSGPTSNPRVRLFSEPELSDIDKLSWLVMGRASDGLGRTDTALLQRAALALLSGEGPGVTDKLLKSIGLDDLSVSQTTEGDVHDTVISLGKQISRRWYVGYERGLNATAGSWQLIYRLAQRITIRAQAGGDSSLDVIWTWRWQ